MYIFARRSVPGAKPLTKFSPAASELAGNLLVYSNDFFHNLCETSVLRIVNDECLPSPHMSGEIHRELQLYLATGQLPAESPVQHEKHRHAYSIYEQDEILHRSATECSLHVP